MFAYEIKDNVTNPGKFLHLSYVINAFKPDTKVVVEMQVYTRNFKQKGNKAGSFKYSFKLIKIYKLENIKLPIVSIPEKRQRGEDKGLAIPSHIKKTLLGLNPLEWIITDIKKTDV